MNLIDSYLWEKERQVLTFAQHHLPGLRTYGHGMTDTVLTPLQEHDYENCIEMIVSTKGSQECTMEGRQYQLRGGDVFVRVTNQPYSINTIHHSSNELYWLQLDLGCKKDFLGLCDAYGDALRQALCTLDCHLLKANRKQLSMLKSAFFYMSHMDANNIQIGQGYLVSFLNELLLHNNDKSAMSLDIIQVLEYINQHLNEINTIDELCAVCNLSQSRLKHKFKEEVGETPMRYVLNRKIEHAKQLLQQGHSITQTAFELGFTSSNYFSSVFKKYTGLSPSVFLEQLHHTQGGTI